MTVNLAINYKKKRMHQLPDYPGEWLPEPIAAESAGALIKRWPAVSISYEGASQGLYHTHRQQLNSDILNFINGSVRRVFG